MKVKFLSTLLLLVLVMLFTVQNTGIGEINLLFREIEMPRSILICSVLLFAVVISWASRGMSKLSKTTE